MRRVAKVIRLKEGCRDSYEEYHRNIWPEVAYNFKKVKIQNYSIFFIDNLLFSYYEYTGDSFEQDMALLASFSETQKWRKIMSDMQLPYDKSSANSGWSVMEEVFFLQ